MCVVSFLFVLFHSSPVDSRAEQLKSRQFMKTKEAFCLIVAGWMFSSSNEFSWIQNVNFIKLLFSHHIMYLSISRERDTFGLNAMRNKNLTLQEIIPLFLII